MAASSGRVSGPAMTTTSDGPAKAEGTPTMPDTWRFASATYRLPGPTMTSTASIDSVPKAMAAMAWAPPTRYTSSTPANAAAASEASSMRPSAAGGTHSATRLTPATRAGTAHMRTVDG